MSGKRVKQLKNAQEAKKLEAETRLKAFMAEIQKLSEKFRVDMVAMLDYKKTGVVPVIQLIDVKDRYEELKGKAAEDAKNGVAPVNPNAPKLEV